MQEMFEKLLVDNLRMRSYQNLTRERKFLVAVHATSIDYKKIVVVGGLRQEWEVRNSLIDFNGRKSTQDEADTQLLFT